MADNQQLGVGPGLKPPPGAAELRASFGDRKPPDISRKITACVACRKLKIKCHMPGSSAPCARCRKRGLSCTVNRSLQMLLEDDASWKQSVTHKIHALEATVDSLSRRAQGNGQGDGLHATPTADVAAAAARAHMQQPAPEVTMDVDSCPATIPASSINEMDSDANPVSGLAHGALPGDVVAEGLVTLHQAEALFDMYADRLDHYLYRILGPSATLAGIRSSSSALLAVICTVGTLHSSELAFLFEPCYHRFLALAMGLAIAKDPNMDDIRALCIGAFWLHDASWNLSSLAVRIATQKHHHRAFRNGQRVNEASLAQTRLYYLVYVCDHHFSIAYGRPPLTRRCDAISRAKQLLSIPQATEDDARLVSQVEVWSIASNILDALGFDVDVPVPPTLITSLRRFVIALDTWRADWNEQFRRHVHVGDYPRKGVKLHYHFAKLYLCSHAFRGLAPGYGTQGATQQQRKSSVGTTPSPASDLGTRMPPSSAHSDGASSDGGSGGAGSPGQLHPDLEEIAMAAVHSAQSILRTTIADTEMQSHLNGLPLYFDTMIAFAIVFLFKVATKYSHLVRIDTSETLGLVADMAHILKMVTANMHRRHLLVAVARAVERLSSRRHGEGENRGLPGRIDGDGSEMVVEPAKSSTAPGPQASYNTEAAMDNWDVAAADFDWMSYDFLASEDTLRQQQDLITFPQGW